LPPCSILFLIFVSYLDIIYFAARAKGGVSSACLIEQSQQAIPALMEDFLFLEEQLKKSSLPLVSHIHIVILSVICFFNLFLRITHGSLLPRELIARDVHDNEWKLAHISRFV